MFAAYATKHDVEHCAKGYMYPAFSYAVLLKKAPWCVEQKTGGAIYECGAAWRDKHNKLTWGNWYVSVNKKTGAIRLLDCLRLIPQKVGYTQKVWRPAPMADAEFQVAKERRVDVLREIFMKCFNSWQIMDSHWKVSVTKAGQRVTWTVPYAETKYFFADRESTATDKNGKRKKIIHFVRQHSRQLSSGKVSMVREHIRGLDSFAWKGYSVDVIAPKFHLSAHDFDIHGHDEDNHRPGKDWVNLSKGANQLAGMEKQHLRKPLPALH